MGKKTTPFLLLKRASIKGKMMRTEGYTVKEEQNMLPDRKLLNFSLANKKEPYVQLYFLLVYVKLSGRSKPVNHQKSNDFHS